MLHVAVWAIALLAVLSALVFAFRLVTRGLAKPSRNKRPRQSACSMLVVLGSGGHTSEMIAMLQGMDGERYTPVAFVVADSDTSSLVRLEKADAVLSRAHKSVHTIPRSREVKQSWTSTLISSLWAMAASVRLVFKLRPELVLVNGPGTCVPICLAAFLQRVLGLSDPTIVFVESVCRVESLSLSGKLLYPVADRFVVHWRELQQRLVASGYRRVEYVEELY